MRHTWGSRVGMVTLIGVMVLSTGLVLMPDSAGAGKPDKGGGSAMDLSGVTQNWDKVLPASQRFTVLEAFNNEAVRDNETGLVWERLPSVNPTRYWSDSRQICVNKNVGGRRGWRLPSVHELASLVDDSQLNPALQPGHPFTISNGGYWSATLDSTVVNGGLYTSVWAVDLGVPGVRSIGNDSSGHIWCVRGPMNADQY